MDLKKDYYPLESSADRLGVKPYRLLLWAADKAIDLYVMGHDWCIQWGDAEPAEFEGITYFALHPDDIALIQRDGSITTVRVKSPEGTTGTITSRGDASKMSPLNVCVDPPAINVSQDQLYVSDVDHDRLFDILKGPKPLQDKERDNLLRTIGVLARLYANDAQGTKFGTAAKPNMNQIAMKLENLAKSDDDSDGLSKSSLMLRIKKGIELLPPHKT